MEDPLVTGIGIFLLALILRAIAKNSNSHHIKIPPHGFDPKLPAHLKKQANPPGFNPVIRGQSKKQMTALIPLRIAQAQRREDLNS